MSMSDKLVGPVESSFQESHGDLTRNNNRCADDSLDGDANANQIQSRDGRTLEEVGTESSFVSHGEEQDKIIIWGTDSQYDDPELAEFEMLECQELEAYLVESDESYGKDRRAPSGTLSSNLSQSEVEIPKDPSKNDASQPDTKEQENVSHRLLSRHAETCIARAEVSSDNDVFVSCYSTMSSLGGSLASAQTAESWPTQTGPYRTLSEDLTVASQSCLTVSDRSKGSLHNDSTHTDLNLNTTVLPEEPLLEAQDKQPAQNVVTYKETSGHLSNGINECNPGIANAAKEHNEVRPASESNVEHHGDPVKEQQAINKEECKHTDAKVITVQHKSCQPFESEDMQSLSMTKSPHDASYERKHKASQSEEAPEINSRCSKPSSKGTLSQGVMVDPKLHKKQASFERTRSASPSSLERRKPWCNSSNPAAPPSPKNTGSPRRQLPSSPAKAVVARVSNQEPPGSPQRGTSGLKPPSKSYLSTGIPKPIPPQPPAKTESPQKSSPKPKNVRPKIITYVRKSPQAKPHSADGPYETSTLPSRLTAYTSSPAAKEQKVGGPKGSPVLSSSNILYDKYRQELQKAGYYSPPGLAVSGIRPPSHTVPHKLVGKSESFHGELPDRYTHEVGRSVQLSGHEVASVYHSPRALKPQLGLGAVTRQPTTRTRMMMPGQRSASPLSHAAPPGQPAYCNPDTTAGDVKKPLLEVAPKSLLPKPGQSGLRPPGFSHLPTARLAAFGFVRSASVSSVSSNQSNESTHSDPCRSTSRPSSGSEETFLPRSSCCGSSDSGSSRPPSCSSPQPSSGHTPTRRSLLPPSHGSPVAARKEFQRDGEVPHPVSSPKRFAVVSPKPQFPVRQKSCVGRLGGRVDGADAERERLLVQSLRERCEEQARQITSLQDKLRKTSLCMDILSITTQHFCRKSENAEVKERELSLELARIRDEVVVSVGRWERLQGEKAELERSFEQELRELKEKQQKEQQALQERLREEQQKEKELLQKQQSSQLQQLRSQHHQQVEEMSESHERAMLEMEVAHNATLATLQEEHARTIKNLRMAHEQQKKSLEEEFEKLRLSLQDQVDTLTFQNRSLRDRAKRFEEALRRSTDEQIVDALAPYQHIEEDLKSLKQVLEMKNQQIHQQELKISELEKLAQKNVLLEERVQVLQQQNEDLKARIDLNLAASRQLSEENANLQEYVEKESNEKKRLSRTNEELLWRLQTGELSPRMSPNQSPLHRPSSGPASPSHPPFPR